MTFETDYTKLEYNAYVEPGEMATYIEYVESVRGRKSGFDTLTTTQKQNKIIDATMAVSHFEYAGFLNKQVVSMYPVKFPRSGLTFPNGQPVPDNIIPEPIKIAMACYIFGTMVAGYNDELTPTEGKISSKKVGDVSVSYDTGSTQLKEATRETYSNKCVSDNIPKEWLETPPSVSVGIGTVKVRRGL